MRALPAVAVTRLTTAEKRGLVEKAAHAGLTTSGYLRRLILDHMADAEVQAQR